VTRDSTDIRVEAGGDGVVVVVTLDRPAALNAYTTRMCEQLADALDGFARADDQRVLVLTGAGRASAPAGTCAGTPRRPRPPSGSSGTRS
jgi:enoyl-CoA hydratase/carnithine racemase